MNRFAHLFFGVVLLALIAACTSETSSSEKTNSETANETVATTEEAVETPPAEETAEEEAIFDEIPEHASDMEGDVPESGTVTLKFVEFELGDAPHYIFVDEAEKYWDFIRCEGENCDFGEEVPLEEANTDNQGWASNPEYQDKWFDITYVTKQEEMYIDGPVGPVLVITEVQNAEAP